MNNSQKYRYYKKREYIFPSDPNFPLRVRKMDSQSTTVRHQHEYCECVFVVRGHGMHKIDDDEPAPVRRGDVFAIPTNSFHAYTEVSDDFSIINLMFDILHLPPVLMELYSSPAYKHVFLGGYQRTRGKKFPITHLEDSVLSEFETMLTCLAHPGEMQGSHCYKLGLFMAVLSRLCVNWEVGADEITPPLDIQKLTVYLEQHFQQKIYSEDLEKLAGMARATLLRHFRAALGMTPMAYLRNLRLSHAAELLKKTDLSTKEVAGQSGFFRMPYFFRAFREFFGVSPLEYRRKR